MNKRHRLILSKKKKKKPILKTQLSYLLSPNSLDKQIVLLENFLLTRKMRLSTK